MVGLMSATKLRHTSYLLRLRQAAQSGGPCSIRDDDNRRITIVPLCEERSKDVKNIGYSECGNTIIHKNLESPDFKIEEAGVADEEQVRAIVDKPLRQVDDENGKRREA